MLQHGKQHSISNTPRCAASTDLPNRPLGKHVAATGYQHCLVMVCSSTGGDRMGIGMGTGMGIGTATLRELLGSGTPLGPLSAGPA